MREVSAMPQFQARVSEPTEEPASGVRTIDPSPAPPAPPSRDVLRSRRPRAVRARTVSMKRMTKRELELGRLLYPEGEHEEVTRPRTRADCENGPRPCPFVSCEHHLYLDVSAQTGAIKLNFPDIEPDELKESCALDVAERDGITLEAVGAIMNLTRERVRQIEVRALAKVAAVEDLAVLRDHYGDVVGGGRTKRRLPLLGDEVDPERFASAELDDDAG